MGQAKKTVRKTATSERNLELRESARQREQSQQLRKKALFLGKEVSFLHDVHDFQRFRSCIRFPTWIVSTSCSCTINLPASRHIEII